MLESKNKKRIVQHQKQSQGIHIASLNCNGMMGSTKSEQIVFFDVISGDQILHFRHAFEHESQ